MYGSISTRGKCPACKGKFSKKDTYGLFCPRCKTRPTRYRVQAKYYGFDEYLYSTPRGEILSSFEHAKRLLQSIRQAWDESRRGGKPFSVDDWQPQKVAKKRLTAVVKDFISAKERRYRKNKLSKSHYQESQNHCNRFILDFFNGRYIDNISEADIQQFYDNLQDRQYKGRQGLEYYSSKHIKDIMMTLRSLYNFVNLDIPDFPDGWKDVKPKKTKHNLTLEMQMKIDPHIPNRHGYRMAMSILQSTAMRPCEQRALLVSDVNDRGVVVWKSLTDRLKKTRKGYAAKQVYPLPEYIMQDLREHIKGKRPDDFIFTVNGKPYHTLRGHCGVCGKQPSNVPESLI